MGGLIHWLLIAILSLLLGRSRSLHITGIDVPHTALSGDTVRLSCTFRLDGDALYSLTWWKDQQMFFNFVPSNSHPKSVYPVRGIVVHVQESTLNEVVLTVDHRASGILRCELLATTFEQDTKQDNMTVVDVPSRGPSITGQRGNYHVGDLLLLNCSSPFSYPPTALTWDINGLQAGGPREIVVTYPGEWDGEGRVSAWSGLHMWLRAHHFREGVLVLRCTASILHVYRVSTELIITDGNYMQTSPREGASTGGAEWSSVVRGMQPLLLLLLLFLHLLGT
ncbi:uncharacterized protein LOC121855256 [Homarus americanus]|uniref:uncharacterized protein LOC121855256 n=1 Tax=Homarus americanus TaxID=6706 RepID=UPI001C436E18|nr:uncharacterized protein LOC121855256 [Homarus americanus]